MKLFIAASYSSQVDYTTGEVLPAFKEWLEGNLNLLESYGHEVFCAQRADGYRINHLKPAEAFWLDMEHIDQADGMIAFVGDTPSTGVQTEIGFAVAMKKQVVLAHAPQEKLSYFNQAMVLADRPNCG